MWSWQGSNLLLLNYEFSTLTYVELQDLIIDITLVLNISVDYTRKSCGSGVEGSRTPVFHTFYIKSLYSLIVLMFKEH